MINSTINQSPQDVSYNGKLSRKAILEWVSTHIDLIRIDPVFNLFSWY